MKKIIIYKIVLVLLIIAAIILSILVIKKSYDSNQNEKVTKKLVEEIKENFEQSTIPDGEEKIIAEMDGYKIVGIIEIPKIDLEYPILEKTDKTSLKLAITKFWGNKINEVGNVSLAGHNNLNGTMFGKLKKLEIGDIIKLTDEQNVTLDYAIFKTYTIDPNDISCIKSVEEGTREVTLITCTNGKNNRYIVKAREVNS